jgi:hypothetical protein
MFVASVEVIKFHTTEPYSNVDLTEIKCSIRRLSRIEKKNVVSRNKPKNVMS